MEVAVVLPELLIVKVTSEVERYCTLLGWLGLSKPSTAGVEATVKLNSPGLKRPW